MHFAIIPMLTASVVFAQTSTVTPTPVQTVVDLFLGAKRQGNYSFAASVISADNIATTYEIMCKSGDLNIPGFPTTTCDLNDPPWTVTDGPSTMVGVLSTAIQNVTAVLGETCVVEGHTAAFCNYTFAGNTGGQTTYTSYTTIITGDKYIEYPVTVTAGVEKLVPTTVTSAWDTTTATGVPLTSGTGIYSASLKAFLMVVLAMAVFAI